MTDVVETVVLKIVLRSFVVSVRTRVDFFVETCVDLSVVRSVFVTTGLGMIHEIGCVVLVLMSVLDLVV